MKKVLVVVDYQKDFVNGSLGFDSASDIENEIVSDSEFVKTLAFRAWENLESIDAVIEKYAKGWKLSRISKVALAVLRMAICEMLYFEDIPVGVSINEAVELCKKYAAKEDASFVNGLLGSVSKEEK